MSRAGYAKFDLQSSNLKLTMQEAEHTGMNEPRRHPGASSEDVADAWTRFKVAGLRRRVLRCASGQGLGRRPGRQCKQRGMLRSERHCGVRTSVVAENKNPSALPDGDCLLAMDGPVKIFAKIVES